MKATTSITIATPKLRGVELISKLLDSQFSINGFKFGIDPILNFIPFAGDGVTAIMSLILVYTMSKHGASSKIVVKMLGNVLIDTIIGGIPLIGWIFDFYYKSNDRNLRLLKEHYQEGKHTGSAKGVLIAALIVFIIGIGIAIWMVWLLTAWLLESIF
jgi:hypothetical protein